MAGIFKACSADGCNRNAHGSAKGAKGFCRLHWGRMKRHGSADAGRTINGEALVWLLDHVSYPGDECLRWPYLVNTAGYGRVTFEGRSVIASRLMCEKAHGPAPSKFHDAAHSCGKGHESCINQRHLSWKTRQENVDDMVVHGTKLIGEKGPMAKLTELQVLEIRKLIGSISMRKIAAMFGVTYGAINGIARRDTWAWL